MTELFLGVDAGGTSSRAALFTLEGVRVGYGVAGGANGVALGLETACANLASAVRQATAALGGTGAGAETGAGTGAAAGPGLTAAVAGPGGVRAAVAGLAGNAVMRQAVVDRVFGEGVVAQVGDVVTAFAAGTPAFSGTALISGTGAIAARIADHAPMATADGYGWQLGDEGSAFWLGRAAARAAIRFLDGQPSELPGGLLAELVVRRLLPDGPPDAGRLAAVVQERPPLALAELAPLVSEAAREKDPAALEIVAEAASLLVRTLSQVHERGRPVVLAGGVLTLDGPVRQAVEELLTEETVRVAGDPAGAAAWLAALPYLGAREAERRHARFVGPQATSSAALP
ncbi:N-acetylglucosamine kinase [Nonomuraea rhizosphaerae]|uniref:N-acetylglucosamine kinase n=1 Tax=Nonomuraea rhizosphaerae TaxID=2665663 RepID=UPI001C5CEE19|nr:BadF/BadG/BcrA/BcrD ATPase family protein [Nonomuraea rhizosphaerae]